MRTRHSAAWRKLCAGWYAQENQERCAGRRKGRVGVEMCAPREWRRGCDPPCTKAGGGRGGALRIGVTGRATCSPTGSTHSGVCEGSGGGRWSRRSGPLSSPCYVVGLCGCRRGADEIPRTLSRYVRPRRHAGGKQGAAAPHMAGWVGGRTAGSLTQKLKIGLRGRGRRGAAIEEGLGIAAASSLRVPPPDARSADHLNRGRTRQAMSQPGASGLVGGEGATCTCALPRLQPQAWRPAPSSAGRRSCCCR